MFLKFFGISAVPVALSSLPSLSFPLPLTCQVLLTCETQTQFPCGQMNRGIVCLQNLILLLANVKWLVTVKNQKKRKASML